ncbi:hypothetical protein FRC01_005387 [Tulasnella sp. 417]|nr:hypothetical protein FRC01_005387 [Tulasnella sp. 417]
MTRHPSAPVGFVQFKNIKSAVNAYQRLKRTTLVVEGRQLDIRYASPRKEHPDSQPLFNCDPGDEESPSSRPPAPTFGPTNTLLIRPKNIKIPLHRGYLRSLLGKLPGLRTLRFRSKILSLCFAEFESAQDATLAMKAIQASHKLDNAVISYAPPKIEREATDRLLFRVPTSTSTFDEEAWKKAVYDLPGLLDLKSHAPHNQSPDDLWVARFDSVEAARNALDQIETNSKLWRFTEASFFFKERQDRAQVQPEPSKALYIANIAQKTSKRDLMEYFSRFEGFRNLILAKSPWTREDPNLPTQSITQPHFGWAIVNFETVVAAQHALDASDGQRCSGSMLRVTFKDDSITSASKNKKGPPAVTNVLFCRELFGVTPEELHEAFEKYEGFQSAQLFPDGEDGFMPYAKVIFDSSGSAVKALEELKSHPMKVGQNDLPIVVEPLRLRKGKKHWKWTRPMR